MSMVSASGVKRRKLRDKRGRPPTTGEYDQLAAAERAAAEARKKELSLRFLEQRLTSTDDPKTSCLRLTSVQEIAAEMSREIVGEVVARALDSAKDVEKMASTSNSLKGGFVRGFRIAGRVAQAAAGELALRTEASCTASRAEGENRILRERVSAQVKEVTALRRAVEAQATAAPASHSSGEKK